jgi:murein DD-endopeptidase MepM/ murein hydrolase activator NlpD
VAKAQQAIDGVQGKDWKITSLMGNRIHPVTKAPKHHNGTDIWAPAEPCWIEAPYDGVITEAKKSTAAGGGFGNYVMMTHKINGEQYTTLYAHMLDDSIKVKIGQKVEAGTPLGKMGSTGMSTGKHLHWELHKGKKYEWSATGLNFIEPIAFFDALIKFEAINGTAKTETPVDAPAAPAPVHGATSAPKPAPAPAPVKPSVAPVAPSATTYKVLRGDTLTRIAAQYNTTVAKLVEINGIKNANLINVGQVLKIG